MKGTAENQPEFDFRKLILVTLAGVAILSAALYIAYRYSQQQPNNIIFPGGITYLGPSSSTTLNSTTPTPKVLFTASESARWKIRRGRLYRYEFSYPETLPLAIFPGDSTDSVAVSWADIPPQLNILLNMEFIDKRDLKYVNEPKINFVKDWWKFFSGLKGSNEVEQFTNSNGLKGYRTSYINNSDITPNVDVFFEVPADNTKMIHLANGVLEATLFDRIVNSVKWIR